MSTLTIENTEAAFKEPDMLAFVLQRVGRHQNTQHIRIFTGDREENGWLEWLGQLEYTDGGKLTIGFIQRRPGDQFESHT